MASRRSYSSYSDGCASAHALDLIGERWALLIVRELLLGPKRFGDLQRDVVGIGPTALTQRLSRLEESGIVVRSRLPEPARVMVYDLTDWGRELEAVNAALSNWAVKSPTLPWQADMSPDTIVLAMRAHARPAAARRRTVAVGLRLTDSRVDGAEPVTYRAVVGPDGTAIERTPDLGAVDAVVTTTTADWKGCIIAGAGAGLDPDAVEGDPAAVRSLIKATRLEIS